MASEKLQKILEMSNKMSKKGKNETNSSHTQSMKPAVSLQEKISNANKAIENIDKIYTSPYVPTQKEVEEWNTERGREELTEMADKNVFMEKLNHSKLPSAIIESMRQNPCTYDPSLFNSVMGEENALFKKLNEAYAKGKEEPISGVKAVQQINEQLENRDKQRLEENAIFTEEKASNNNIVGNFSLEMLEETIEKVIDRKFNTLNESLTHKLPSSVKTMSLTENGNFRFLDSEDNVYECQMKYLGKRKKTKK